VKRKKPILAGFALCVGASLFTFRAVGLTWNASPSMPEGIWRAAQLARPVARGDIVTLCLASNAAQLGLSRGYLAPGHCPDGVEEVLKPAAAVQGDIVSVSPAGVAVNGEPLPHTAPLPSDDKGRSLQAVEPGTYFVGKNEIWVISTHEPRSFDSRYFGPVPVKNIRGTAAPIIIGD
jgi:conjugative transfer signal peptidase TraF